MPGISENPGMAVDHYENFPVASVLCPPRLRQPIVAIYRFARTADDLADEGDASAHERLAQLAAFRHALDKASHGRSPDQHWPEVFGPLGAAIQTFGLPTGLLHDLISAFEQDVRYTAAGHLYANRQELLDYCRLSANPVGRLLLHLYGIHDPESLSQSDCICSALQLINFWQDLSVDIPRRRHYLTIEACTAFGVERATLLAPLAPLAHPNAIKLIASEAVAAAETMKKGQDLATRIPGRAGWELRLVVQGGLRILDKIAALQHDTLHHRPTLTAWDLPLMAYRALRM